MSIGENGSFYVKDGFTFNKYIRRSNAQTYFRDTCDISLKKHNSLVLFLTVSYAQVRMIKYEFYSFKPEKKKTEFRREVKIVHVFIGN